MLNPSGVFRTVRTGNALVYWRFCKAPHVPTEGGVWLGVRRLHPSVPLTDWRWRPSCGAFTRPSVMREPNGKRAEGICLASG